MSYYIFQVLEKVDRHWWYGCCGGKYGKFPGSYLVPVEIPSLEDNHELFAAVSDFPHQQDGDLAFTKGDLFHRVFFMYLQLFITFNVVYEDGGIIKKKSTCYVSP